MVDDSKTRPGHPFGSDYADPRTAEQLDIDRAAVGKQVDQTESREAVHGFHQELVERLGRRRSSERALQEEVQFVVLPDADGWSTLMAAGELLIPRSALEDERLRSRLGGFTEREGVAEHCPELSERVARFVNPALAGEEPRTAGRRLAEIAGDLRRDGFRVSVDHITPLAAVVKRRGGPEKTTPLARFVRPAAEQEDRVRVAVIDTGVADQDRSDGWLQPDDVPRDHVDPLDRFPAPGGDTFLDYGAGHGTFAAAVVQQVHPEALVAVYNPLDSDGIGTEMAVACAMIRAVKEGARIVNLSLGTRTVDDGPPVALQAALDVIDGLDGGRDVVLVAAAGNYGDTRACWPAAFRRVVSVAGVRADLTPSTWSSRGPWVDCSAVGEGVVAAYVEGTEANELDPANPEVFGPDAWALWTGTSFAAPQVAAAIARLSAEGGVSPREALAQLLSLGVPVPGFGQALRILPGTPTS